MEKGKGTGKHRDTGQPRSEPEEGKHTRRPEGRAGRQVGQPRERLENAGISGRSRA